MYTNPKTPLISKGWEPILKKSLKINIDFFGENHYSTAIFSNNLAFFYFKKANLIKSEEYIQKSLKISLALFGENHSNTATFCNNLSLLYTIMGNHIKSEEYSKKSLKSYQSLNFSIISKISTKKNSY